jgi:hypothetical protein
MKIILKSVLVLLAGLSLVYSCVKDKGKNPQVAFTDYALLDSCKNEAAFRYYKDAPNTTYPGTNGAHGTYKLKFNHKAYSQLVDSGKLPVGKKFTDGSMIVKEVYKGSTLDQYALMYKYNGAWLWAEITPDFKIPHSVKADQGVCTSCHSQSGNRDLVATFKFH